MVQQSSYYTKANSFYITCSKLKYSNQNWRNNVGLGWKRMKERLRDRKVGGDTSNGRKKREG